MVEHEDQFVRGRSFEFGVGVRQSLHMDYVDWVQVVADGAFRAWESLQPGERMLGTSFVAVIESLGLPTEDEKAQEAVGDALTDLQSLGLLEFEYHRYVKFTQEGRKIRSAPLQTAWPAVFETFIDEEQRKNLQSLVRLSEERYESYVCLREVTGEAWMTDLGVEWKQENWGVAYEASSSLEGIGLSRDRSAMGGTVAAWPTYAGFVLATREAPTKLRSLVSELWERWETVEVDFKSQLSLETEANKAEFVRDALALSNSQAAGRRFLVIGFHDGSRAFSAPTLASVSADRMDNILAAWCRRAPRIEYSTVDWDRGQVGLIEFIRDPLKLPYLAAKGTAKLRPDLVYVRHGRHSVPASAEETADIEREGERARRLVGQPGSEAAAED